MNRLVAIRPPQRGLLRGPKTHLRGLAPDELAAWLQKHVPGPKFRARQVFEWIHKHRVVDFDAMTNLGRADRARLAELADIHPLRVDLVQRSSDGTRKLRLRTDDDEAIECVLIPNETRGFTLCISSMVGCSLTCRFCATATLGFVRNLSTWEIFDQVYRAQDLLADEARNQGEDEGDPEHDGEGDDLSWAPRVTNLVFMGMGEPLHNFNQVRAALRILTDPHGPAIAGRRITVSTSGLVPGIERFAAEGLGEEVGLAVSLNATTDAIRDEIMPINTRWPIAALLEAVRKVPTPKRRRITFEYVLLADVNDSDADARRLDGLLREFGGLGQGDAPGAQVNVIPFNPHAGAPYRRPSPERVARFVALLRKSGLLVHVRTPRGDDIAAACGQLALGQRSVPHGP